MPNWLKITLIVVGIGLLVLVAGGFLAARALKAGAEGFEAGIEAASSAGKEFGASSTMDGCIENAVGQSAECSMFNLTCAPNAGTFLWGCLEAAPYDAAFCADVPDTRNDDADVIGWCWHACARHGQVDSDICTVVVGVVPGFCTAKRQAE